MNASSDWPKLFTKQRSQITILKTLLSEYQINQLQIKFNEKKYLSMAERAEIAITLNITQNQVKIWFQVSYGIVATGCFISFWDALDFHWWFQNKREKEKRRHTAEKAKNGRSGVSGPEPLHVKPSTYESSKYESSQSASSKMARYEPSVPSPSFIAMPPGGHYSLGQQSRNEFKTMLC